MKILFVCLGNICRSPIAEGVLRHLTKDAFPHWQIDSAGTESYHIGQPPHLHSQAVCKEYGIDISMQRARKFVKQDIESYDIVYALASDVYREIENIAGNKMDKTKVRLFLSELYPDTNKSVTDPWYGGKEGYYPVYEEIKKCCEVIVEKYGR